ncbi:unnamed protein product [Strongylus vulgaris]|uniref:Uncharacterized protein n=1 Tax=Strongylus vulgaris TaxID=40348 RepID=A0A3P7JJ69_STRVU|nr:unnamed protein product [Strongylus vulgaris]
MLVKERCAIHSSHCALALSPHSSFLKLWTNIRNLTWCISQIQLWLVVLLLDPWPMWC